MVEQMSHEAAKYPVSIRVLHWVRAVLILGLLLSGITMTRLPETTAMETFNLFYNNHKQFGVLVWLLAVVHLVLRWRNRAVLPHMPDALKPWEKVLSHLVHRVIIVLVLLVPLLGYSMSASFTQSDGVPFFFFGHVPEILPKNDDAFEVFDKLHQYSAYLLLTLVALHAAGAIKHRLFDRGGPTDVLPRML
ncbi:MAG: cytochrome b/b6 domain-containing protein [Alteraurantiacibacter sp.]